MMLKLSHESLVGLAIPEEAKAFLEETGLPGSAPVLSFLFNPSIETVAAKYGLEDSELDEGAAEFVDLPVIGSDGSGNPICIDSDGRVLIVDHEGFDEAQVLNSSLPRLLKSLAVYDAYRQVTDSLTPLPSDADAWNHALSDAAVNLQALDPVAYSGFWHATLAGALTPLGFDIEHMDLGSELAVVIAPLNGRHPTGA